MTNLNKFIYINVGHTCHDYNGNEKTQGKWVWI